MTSANGSYGQARRGLSPPRFAPCWAHLYMSAHRADGIDTEDLEHSRPLFGMIIFQSNLEMSCGTVYKTYNSRWLIELFFRSREDTIGMDNTREHSDYSVIASNFVNRLSSIMLSNMFRFLNENNLLDNHTYGEILRLLLRIKMTRTSGDNRWKVRRIAEIDVEILEKIDLLNRPIVPKKSKRETDPRATKIRNRAEKDLHNNLC